MEAVQDIYDKYLLQESYLQGGSEVYSRETSLAVSFFNGENQYTQDNIDTTQRNHLYRIEIEDRFGLKKKFPHLLIEIVNKQNKKKTYILRNKDVAQERLKQLKQSEE